MATGGDEVDTINSDKPGVVVIVVDDVVVVVVIAGGLDPLMSILLELKTPLLLPLVPELPLPALGFCCRNRGTHGEGAVMGRLQNNNLTRSSSVFQCG